MRSANRALEEAKHANAEADLTQYILDDKLSRLSPEAEGKRLDRARQFLAARFHNEPVLGGTPLDRRVGKLHRYR